jgi:CheY-like chemotaxis protein
MAHPGPRALDGFSILVVDDDGDARELLEMYLVAAGATVTTASSAADALERFTASPPAVVVTDIAMPRLDGIWLLNAIRSLPESPRVPVLALTALAMPKDRAEIKAAGFDAHIIKPADLDEVAATIAVLVRRGT